jgi:hypothetical protein
MPLILSGSGGISGVTGTFGKETMPVGSVLQVVSTTKTDTFSTTSASSYVTITGLTATITPSSSTSKILVLYDVWFGSTSGTGSVLAIDRNGTLIGRGASGSAFNASGGVYSESGTNEAYFWSKPSGSFLDAPSSTSAITYSLQTANTGGGGGTTYVNRRAADLFVGGASTLTLMEIKG